MILAFKAATISAGEAYWMGIWNTASTAYDVGNAIYVHNNQDIYVGGERWDGSNSNALLIKFDQTPDVLFGRKVNPASSVNLRAVVANGSYVYGAGNDAIFQWNTSGTLQWQRKYTRTLGTHVSYTTRLDASGNVTVGGNANSRASFAEISTAGANTLGKFYEPNTHQTGAGHWLDSSDNYYLISYGSGYGQLMKFNSSGTFQWNTQYGNGSNQHHYIVGNSTGETFISSRYTNAPSSAAMLKFNNSGSLIWQRKLAAAQAIQVTGGAIDSAGNVYLCGFVDTTAYLGLIAKWDSSGTLQWQRTLASGDGDFKLYAMCCDNNDNIYVTGQLRDGSLDVGFIAKLPSDGSKTGTYNFSTVSVTYAASSYTGSTPTQTTTAITDSTVNNLTQSTPTYTEASQTITDEYKAL